MSSDNPPQTNELLPQQIQNAFRHNQQMILALEKIIAVDGGRSVISSLARKAIQFE